MVLKYSIIVPIYNISSLIDQCVESLVNQTYKKLEIILVNDGSKDNSLEIIKKWERKDSRIFVVNKPNGGLSSARNEGLKSATGDYVLYVDGDDWIDVETLAEADRFIAKYGLVDMICFNYYAYYSENDKKLISYNSKETISSGEFFFENSTFKMTAWSKIYKRTYLEEIGLNFLEGRLHEDLSYTIPLCICANKVGYINRPLYYYRQNRKGSIMAKLAYKNVLDYSHALCFDYYFLKPRVLSPYFKHWLMDNFFKSCFTGHVSIRTVIKAFKENNVYGVFEDMNTERMFWLKVFCYHYYMKARVLGGQLKRKLN